MQNQNTKINFLVGLFVLGGIVALLFLALQAANLSSFSTSKGYEVTAYFDNIGGLKAQALRSEAPVCSLAESNPSATTTTRSRQKS